MRFAVVGGDRRSVLLCALLIQDGHRVRSWALEGAELDANVQKAGCLQGCVYGADCVVLPTPCERNGRLIAPYASQPVQMTEIYQALWQGQTVCGGAFSDETNAAAAAAGVVPEDILKRRDFAVENAALTAEGAIGLMISRSEKSLWRSRVLICGFGRIGKILALRLCALGCNVTVAARKAQDRAQARIFGCAAVGYAQLEPIIDSFDFVVNTVPVRIIGSELLCCMREGTTIVELASAPYGFDAELAENVGLDVVSAPGLPGKSAPYAAACLIRDAVYDILRESEE